MRTCVHCHTAHIISVSIDTATVVLIIVMCYPFRACLTVLHAANPLFLLCLCMLYLSVSVDVVFILFIFSSQFCLKKIYRHVILKLCVILSAIKFLLHCLIVDPDRRGLERGDVRWHPGLRWHQGAGGHRRHVLHHPLRHR